MKRSTPWLALGIGAFVFLAVPTGRAAAQRPHLAGAWVLNRGESDDPRDTMRGMRGGQAGQGMVPRAGGRRGGTGGRGGARRGGPGGAAPNQQGMQQAMRAAMQASERVVLVQNDSAVTLTYAGQAQRTLVTNGKKWKEEIGDGVEIQFKAEWKDEELRVEREFEGGAKLKETYRLSPDGDQLFVLTRLETRRMPEPIEFRRVYDRTEP